MTVTLIDSFVLLVSVELQESKTTITIMNVKKCRINMAYNEQGFVQVGSWKTSAEAIVGL